MANFTEVEAKAAKVKTFEKVSTGVLIRASHPKYYSVEWIDSKISDKAKEATITNAVIKKLTNTTAVKI